MPLSGACPICAGQVQNEQYNDYGDKVFVDCKNCGMFGVTRLAVRSLEAKVEKWKGARWLLSQHIRRATAKLSDAPDMDTPVFDQTIVDKILECGQTPSLREQSNSFIRWLGDELRRDDPGASKYLSFDECAAIMGSGSSDSAAELITTVINSHLLNERGTSIGFFDVGLTFEGWDAYEELRRSHSEGPIAFMAMPFGDSQLDHVFRTCFKPAVEQCGFDLRRLDEAPRAGLIDNHLRVEIRRSRFLVVDLTNENRGAYWEAGFAEGLGKPVVYTCEQEHFLEKGTHFDTHHHQTVVWSPDNLSIAAQQLKDTIRATLPTEARLSD